ncbi:MAG: 16S rRNA (cytosine(1402)-N(4))-methyltransferase [Flavobacteriales bacterium]|nr:16S rRNA (cytosine(1402)-N(4))-methyltransferase RsmH [Bacteroidales bacterium AH-315-I05]PCJ89035.1 MAG: 16S rRNA (cytosine(1402)-N(4))-methyltransferase [Flavobacteriales bacterium]
MSYHQPVLLQDCIEGLNVQPKGIYADVTLGGGGHSKEILKKLGEKGRLIGFDQDEAAEGNAKEIVDERFVFVRQNFSYMKNFLRMHNALPLNGLLADLGVSSHQIDTTERGFSIRSDAELDMRMDKNSKLTAKDVVNKYSEKELLRIFKEYGEVKNAKKLANAIVTERAKNEIKTTGALKTVISNNITLHPSRRVRGGLQKYLAQVFQALRIEVNNELEALKELLNQSVEVLTEGGRLVVISYHSLEDRLVKNFIKTGNFQGEVKKDFYGNIIRPFTPVSRKVIVPSEEEINKNNRARSAKLRIAEKL